MRDCLLPRHPRRLERQVTRWSTGLTMSPEYRHHFARRSGIQCCFACRVDACCVDVFASLTGLISPSPWPSPARGEGKYLSCASNTFSRHMDSSCLTPAFDPCAPLITCKGRGKVFFACFEYFQSGHGFTLSRIGAQFVRPLSPRGRGTGRGGCR